MPEHPIEELFQKLGSIPPYPAGVLSIPERVPGTAFFPGGLGLWTAHSAEGLPPMPVGGVMVLGHNFDSEKSYLNSLRNPGANLRSGTWLHLLRLLDRARISPAQCFFTNVFMGLIEGEFTLGQFPGAKDAGFVQRCRSFLIEQLAAQRPRLIMTLGGHVPPVIAPLSPDLDVWRPWRGFPELDRCRLSLLNAVRFQRIGLTTTVAALTHPSMGFANLRHRRYGTNAGADAQLAMVKDALVFSGIAAVNSVAASEL